MGWLICLHGRFGQHPISRTVWHEPNVSVDILDRMKCVLTGEDRLKEEKLHMLYYPI